MKCARPGCENDVPDGGGFEYDPSDTLVFCSLDCAGQVADEFPMLVGERSSGRSFLVSREPSDL
jgi:hypothetical protein